MRQRLMTRDKKEISTLYALDHGLELVEPNTQTAVSDTDRSFSLTRQPGRRARRDSESKIKEARSGGSLIDDQQLLSQPSRAPCKGQVEKATFECLHQQSAALPAKCSCCLLHATFMEGVKR